MKINTNSKNFKIILFSVIGLVVLAGVVLVLTLTAPKDENADPEETTVTTEDPALILQPEDMGAIKSIYVENSQGSYTVNVDQKDGEKVYSLKELGDVDSDYLSSSVFSTLEKNLTDMTARSVVEENPSDLAQYGLDKPQAKAVITYENGSFACYVGNTVTTGAANYFMIEGKNTVYSYYTYSLEPIMEYKPMNFVNTSLIPSFAQSGNDSEIQKITVRRSDWDEPLVLEKLPDLPEDSTSIQVYSYSFKSPYEVYLDMNTGTDFLNAMSGLSAEEAVLMNPTEEDYEKYGLSEPFCQVDQLIGETIYRLYIGNAVTEEVTDEETGVVTKNIVAYYGYSNKAPYAIFRISASSLIWASMDVGDYMSKQFLMPYIYDLDTFSYKDKDSEFTVKVEGDSEENSFSIDGKEADGENFRKFYQFVISCRGEELYTEDEKGELAATYTFTYKDEREPNTVSLYTSEDRTIIIEIDGKNVFKTKWNYHTRLMENAAAFLSGGEIVDNY